MFGGRKKPFSGKKKKQQLQKKRDRHRGGGEEGREDEDEVSDVYPSERTSERRSKLTVSGRSSRPSKPQESHGSDAEDSASDPELQQAAAAVNHVTLQRRPSSGQVSGGARRKYDPNRYRLKFTKQSKDDIEKEKDSASNPVKKIENEKYLEVSAERMYPTEVDMPRRPAWNYNMSKAEVETAEEEMFADFVEETTRKGEAVESYFELNLETWRQLWRVVEMADVLLVVVYIRFPCIQTPLSLYKYVVRELRRPVLLVLNKVDLAPPGLVIAWKRHLLSVLPVGRHRIRVVYFSSFAGQTKGFEKKARRSNKMASIGPKQLYEACKEIVQDKVDLSKWKNKLENRDLDVPADGTKADGTDGSSTEAESYPVPRSPQERFRNGILTIACVGLPNSGKSSLLNSLFGRKLVAVSKTPGKTKHFQTLFLTPTVRLCDCPGLVFPSACPRVLQILSGSFPVAQVRAPYAAVGYLAARVDLITALKLHQIPGAAAATQRTARSLRANRDLTSTSNWSPLDICEAWAEKRGFVTAKGGRLDVYRAANSILRLAVNGNITLLLYPPGYTDKKETFENDAETLELKRSLEVPGTTAGDAGHVGVAGLLEPGDSVSCVSYSEFSTSGSDDEGIDGDESSSDDSNPFSVLASQ